MLKVVKSMRLSVVIFWSTVGLHQSSVLIHLLFIIELEALSAEITSGCPEKLLNVSDMTLVSEIL